MFLGEWRDVDLRDNINAGNFSFQAALHVDGEIMFCYKQVTTLRCAQFHLLTLHRFLALCTNLIHYSIAHPVIYRPVTALIVLHTPFDLTILVLRQHFESILFH